MEELIQRITAATGLSPEVAHSAVGIVLGFLKSHAPAGPIGDLINSIPGSEAAVAAQAGASGGLMGAVGGMLGGLGSLGGGAGDLMGLAGKLSSAGVDMGQMQNVGKEIFNFAKDQVGEEKMAQIASAVPGLSKMM